MWFMWFVFIVHVVSFWLSALEAMRQPRKRASLAFQELLPWVLLNQFIVTPLCIWGMTSLDPELVAPVVRPSFYQIILAPFQYVAMLVIMNAAFALAHYGFHRIRWLYRHVHYLHHRLKVPHPIGAIYAHPVEQVIANLLPVGLAMMIVHPPSLLGLIFVAHTSWETVQGHTDYLDIDSSRHNFHHCKGNCNYDNSPYLFDRLIGTYH